MNVRICHGMILISSAKAQHSTSVTMLTINDKRNDSPAATVGKLGGYNAMLHTFWLRRIRMYPASPHPVPH